MREGGKGSLEHLEDFQSQIEGKIRLQTWPAHRLYLLPRMTLSSPHTPEAGVQSGPRASTPLFSLSAHSWEKRGGRANTPYQSGLT